MRFVVSITEGMAHAWADEVQVTGKGGIEDARAMCKAADKATGFDTSKGNRNAGGNLVMSTGVIGQRYATQAPRLSSHQVPTQD